MDLSIQLDQVNFTSGKNADRLNFLDLRFSNLPLDYLNGVLPVAQFGSESVVSLGTSQDTIAVKAFATSATPVSLVEPDNSTPSDPFLPVKFPSVIQNNKQFNDPQIIYGQSGKDGSSHVLKSQGNAIPGAKLMIQDYTVKKVLQVIMFLAIFQLLQVLAHLFLLPLCVKLMLPRNIRRFSLLMMWILPHRLKLILV